MTRRRKAADPAVAAAQKAARKRVVDELEARGIEVNYDEQYRIVGARRVDVFSLLHERKALTDLQLYAARRLEVLAGTAFGHERPDHGERVDTSSTGAPGQNITQAMIDAQGVLRTIMGSVGFTNAKLLNALLAQENSPSIMTRWRKTVSDCTGEDRSEVQAAMIRSACENLAEAFKAFDYRARERRERAA